MCVPPSDEAIQEPFSPAQQKEDEVSCFSSMISNDTLFHDSESEEEMEALDKVDVPCCAIKEKEAVHDDEAITHAENTKAIKAPCTGRNSKLPYSSSF
jgi:crotonobetainyl-CoA:carnitine CoA-transferase CaiB-like acyl-CoA transferase